MRKYELIYNTVKEKINSGEYKQNSKIPNEKEMMHEFSASRATVKRAIDILVSEGLIFKVRGSGTFVKNFSSENYLNKIIQTQIMGFSKTNKDKKIKSKLLEFEVVRPGKYIASQLNISESDFTYKVKRVRYANDEPYLIETVYMPINLIPGINEEILKNSIYSYIEEQLNLTIQSAFRKVRADFPNDEDKKHLKITDKTLIVEVEQICYLSTGEIFEYTIVRHRNDKFEAVYVITKD